RSRALWLEWGRRLDARLSAMTPAPDQTQRADLGYAVGLDMAREGLIDPNHLWGTIACLGVGAAGDLCGVTSTSGLAWQIPGRVGDSPILGAGLYVRHEVGAAGSTGRGESTLFNLPPYGIVEAIAPRPDPKTP